MARQPRRRRRARSPQRRLSPQSAERAIELKVPRTRRPVSVIRSYARRAPEIDRAILAGFVLSTRKVGETLLSLLGRPVAPTTVSRVAKTLDAAVQARRPLTDSYKALMLDGVVLSRKTGAGALKRPVLVVLGLRPDGRKEIVDYRPWRGPRAPPNGSARSLRSRPDRRRSGDDLRRRRPGLAGSSAHRVPRHPGPALPGAQDVSSTRFATGHRQAGSPRCRPNHTEARSAARRKRWEDAYPRAVACLRDDLDDLLTCFQDPDQRRQVRTTNAIERREVRRRTLGAFQDRTSMDRILFAIFIHENKQQGISTLFPLKS